MCFEIFCVMLRRIRFVQIETTIAKRGDKDMMACKKNHNVVLCMGKDIHWDEMRKGLRIKCYKD